MYRHTHLLWVVKVVLKMICFQSFCFPARAQAFSWLSYVIGLQSKRDKNNYLKSNLVQTLSMNEEKIFVQAHWKSL